VGRVASVPSRSPHRCLSVPLSPTAVKRQLVAPWLRPGLRRLLGQLRCAGRLFCQAFPCPVHVREHRPWRRVPARAVPTISRSRAHLADTRCEAYGVGQAFCLARWNGTSRSRCSPWSGMWAVTAAIHSSTHVPDTPVESFVSSDLTRTLGWQGARTLLRATALCYLCMRPRQHLWGHTGGEVPPQKADGPCTGWHTGRQ
jgi:hypothetical protein